MFSEAYRIYYAISHVESYVCRINSPIRHSVHVTEAFHDLLKDLFSFLYLIKQAVQILFKYVECNVQIMTQSNLYTQGLMKSLKSEIQIMSSTMQVKCIICAERFLLAI